MINYDEKMAAVYYKQGGQCAISGKGCTRAITELHHRCHKTKWRAKLYPHFIDSLLNLVGVCHACHMNQPHYGKIIDREADAIEKSLVMDPDMARKVNCDS